MAKLGEAIKRNKKVKLSGALFVWKCQDVLKALIVPGWGFIIMSFESYL